MVLLPDKYLSIIPSIRRARSPRSEDPTNYNNDSLGDSTDEMGDWTSGEDDYWSGDENELVSSLVPH